MTWVIFQIVLLAVTAFFAGTAYAAARKSHFRTYLPVLIITGDDGAAVKNEEPLLTFKIKNIGPGPARSIKLENADGIEKERLAETAIPSVLDAGNESLEITINFDNQRIQKESLSPSPLLVISYMDVFGGRYKSIAELRQNPVPPYYFHPTVGDVRLQLPWKWF
jgi:hypothetical protein